MALFQGLFFLLLGVLIVLFVYKSPSRGWMPVGAAGRLQKEEQPVGFWVVLVLYAIAGLTMTVYALLVLFGAAQPLPLR